MTEKISSLRIVVKAEREIAYQSFDHIFPWGTRRDNSRNWRFNQKLYQLFPNQKDLLRILDLGCSGGGFVRDCLNDGCLAVGLEGSDFSQKYGRAEWATIPKFLFTCDITGDFEVLFEEDKGFERLQFDVVTSWDVLEHIAEHDLPKVAENVKKHLKSTGLWIMSISPRKEEINGICLHQTIQPKSWWIQEFKKWGFENSEEYVRYFNSQFVRGPKYGAPDSFHLVLTYNTSKVFPIPKQNWKSIIYDVWLGSHVQQLIRRWVVGS